MDSSRYISETGIKADTPDTVAQLIIEQRVSAGTINVRGIPVSYDLVSGEASLQTRQVSPGVQNEYDFADVLPLVAKAISFVVKCELLKQLYDLNDQQVKSRINANHRDPQNPNELSFLTVERVDATLRQIQRGPSSISFFKSAPVSPLQAQLNKALKDIDGINSRTKVQEIMQQVNSQPQAELKPASPSSP